MGAVPAGQRLRRFAGANGADPANQDGVQMAFDRVVEFAVNHRQRIGEPERTGDQFGAFEAGNALDAATGKAVGDVQKR